MVEFIAFSNMRALFAEEEENGISESVLKKIDEICEKGKDSNFVVSLGNTIEGCADKEKSLSVFRNILRRFDRKMSVHALMGENDSTITKRDFLNALGYSMRYNAFDVVNYRCIFLDTLIGDKNDAYVASDKCEFSIDEEQLLWLSRILGKSHRTSVIFSHAPIAVSDKENEKLLVSGSEKLRELIEKSGKVALVVSGGTEKPDLVISNNVPYINLASLSFGENPSFAKISVSSKGVEVMGFGNQQSYSVPKHPVHKAKKRGFSPKLFFKSLFK